MLTLRQMPPAWGLPNPSPFCAKVETFLRMTDIPYRTAIGDPRKGPKGKLPWIEDGETRVSDSGHILAYLAERYGKDLDSDLTPEQRAVGHLLRRTMEESLYWVATYANFAEDHGWSHVRALFAEQMPPVVRTVVPPLIRRNILRLLHAQGTGRHARDDVYAIGIADLEALSVVLGDKPYLLGERATSVDATGYGFLGAIIEPAVMSNPLREYAHTRENLVAYCARMKERYFAHPPGASADAAAV